jgi:uncharacterized metal-binding protein
VPNKKTHQKLTLLASITAMPIIFFLPPEQSLPLIGGILITWFPEMGPDLDINSRHFGAIGGFIGLKAYAEVVPHRYGFRKRHWLRLRIWNVFLLSHIPFIGTIPRTLILLLPISLFFILFNLWLPEILRTAIFIWLGMSYSDVWHVLADLIASDLKEMRKDYWRQRKYWGKELTKQMRNGRI